MSLLDAVLPAGAVSLGNSPGWLLTFAPAPGAAAGLTLSCEEYEATIDATLPAGLAGGSYTVVLHGCTDAHHAALAGRTGAAGDLRVVRLHLYWRDVNQSVLGYLAGAAGLPGLSAALPGGTGGGALDALRAAELAVQRVGRRVGARQYETVLTLVERAWTALARPLGTPITARSTDAAAATLAGRAGVPITVHSPDPAPLAPDRPGTDSRTFGKRSTGRDVLRELAATLGHGRETFGRSLLLVRDGAVHVGTRPVPLAGGPRDLTPETGLLSVDRETPIALGDGRERPQLRVLLRGRGDLRPGDVVRVAPPEVTDASTLPTTGAAVLSGLTGIAGALLPGAGGDLRRAYVSGVKHSVAARTGFTSTLSVIVLEDGDEAWPRSTEPAVRRRSAAAAAATSPDPAVTAADAVRGVVAGALDDLAMPDVGEVREQHTAGSAEPPGQTTRVWRGLTGDDGRPGAVRRVDVERKDPEEVDGVPYLTPFAWGKCGLVVPRYPGTRVLLAHRNGYAAEPVDVGAMWTSGQGPDSHPGDWWLGLPVGVRDRSAAGQEGAVPPTAATATNDLVDADGDRRIEVGRLTVRVGPAGLAAPGTRPEPTAARRVVSVEHADGTTRITVDEDGNVSIVATGTLALSGAQGITLDAGSGDVTVTCAQMKVN
ncbi:hypothetical protein [Modestobacter lapidis]|nr:hypothetical protein [Modestobacter lapidis]